MIKLIIWDLDDTLWRGTLAEGDAIEPYQHRIDLIRALNARGVVSSICSKNDPDAARAKLDELGWSDAFVFSRIAFEPKPQAIAAILADMQLRPANTLFVDDNHINLEAVRHHLPAIATLDITRPDADATLADLLARQTGTRSRVPQYRMLEARKSERTAAATLSDEEFLRTCEIKAVTPWLMENLDFVERIAELVNRSNQLNYTRSRVTAHALREDIIDVLGTVSLAIFASDKHGDHGLVGFVMLERAPHEFRLKHFTFSCRVMHMGLERFAIEEVLRRTVGMLPAIEHAIFADVAHRLSPAVPDWIEAISYSDPAIRAALLAKAGAERGGPAPIRIMWNCQSAGIAHYSDHRTEIAFDSVPDVFALRAFWDGSPEPEAFPPFLVYGAGSDYADPAWEGLTDQLEKGLHAACVERLCAFMAAHDRQLLVFLPPETLASDQYHPWMGHSLERTIAFNAVWREVVAAYPNILAIDLSNLLAPDEAKDVNHYIPSALQQISCLVDTWYDALTSAGEDEARLVA